MSFGHFKIYNESCFETFGKLKNRRQVDLVITSPPYNTNKKSGGKRNLQTVSNPNGYYDYLRYDTMQDDMTQDEYCEFLIAVFENLDEIVSDDGVILLNLSYGNENPDGMWLAVAAIIENTCWTVADCISWQKSNALPNNNSKNRLTRICEFVFLFCRDWELSSFYASKEIVSWRKSGQPVYSGGTNLIKARNNDGDKCPYNKAVFSTELVGKLLDLYAPDGATVYDPFIGTGTTAVASVLRGYNCIGSEISANQCKWALERVRKAVKANGESEA